jgi:hypothetical protein
VVFSFKVIVKDFAGDKSEFGFPVIALQFLDNRQAVERRLGVGAEIHSARPSPALVDLHISQAAAGDLAHGALAVDVLENLVIQIE